MTRVVVADASPLRYLAQIGQIELLPRRFKKVHIPPVVHSKLHPSAPEGVRSWMNSRPEWLEVSEIVGTGDSLLRKLDEGERAAIELGLFLSAGLILIDH